MKKIVALVLAMALAACQSQTDPLTGRPQVSNTAAGAGLGAAAGALAGLLVAGGGSGADKRKSALIGAGIGALVGGATGSYMDRQEAELRAQLASTGVSVARDGDRIILVMPDNITFATDSDQLHPAFLPVIDSVAIVLQKYPQTLLDIDGHTDATGSPEYNQNLSERRAFGVANELHARGIDPRRLLVQGFGPSRPVASNATAQGRAQNRRVEIFISPLT